MYVKPQDKTHYTLLLACQKQNKPLELKDNTYTRIWMNFLMPNIFKAKTSEKDQPWQSFLHENLVNSLFTYTTTFLLLGM